MTVERRGGRCVICAAAPICVEQLPRDLLRADDTVIAADGGIRLVRALGREPNIIVADFDSFEYNSACSQSRIITLPVQKDDTDTMAAARIAADEGFTNILLLGASGGRLDHTIANLAVMAWLVNRGITVSMINEKERVAMYAPGKYEIHTNPDEYLSILPYGGSAAGVTVENVQYPLRLATLSCDYPLGISNRPHTLPAVISFTDGILIIFISKD